MVSKAGEAVGGEEDGRGLERFLRQAAASTSMADLEQLAAQRVPGELGVRALEYAPSGL